MAEAMTKSEGGSAMWVPVVSAVISGAVSGVVGYWLGSREKPCACKAKLNGNGTEGSGGGDIGNGGGIGGKGVAP